MHACAGSMCVGLINAKNVHSRYYDENLIFPIAAILKHKLTNSLCEKKNAVSYIQISLFVPEIFKFLNYAN